jgi:hypothetical protein
MQPGQRTRFWFLIPSCLIDRFLDHVEGFGSFVLPTKPANPPVATEVEARLEQLGA